MASFLIDIHCHTAEHSYDGVATGEEIVRGVLKAGFHGIVFTDHSEVWTPEELAELREKVGVPEDFLLLSAQEVRTALNEITCGDLLVYGPKSWIPDGTSPMEVLRLAREANGFCIAPHAGVPHIGFGENLRNFPVMGVETWNGRYGLKAEKKSKELAVTFDLPAVGGSDTHRVENIAGGGTLFPRMPRDFADMAEMIGNHECEPWKPTVLGSAVRWFRR